MSIRPIDELSMVHLEKAYFAAFYRGTRRERRCGSPQEGLGALQYLNLADFVFEQHEGMRVYTLPNAPQFPNYSRVYAEKCRECQKKPSNEIIAYLNQHSPIAIAVTYLTYISTVREKVNILFRTALRYIQNSTQCRYDERDVVALTPEEFNELVQLASRNPFAVNTFSGENVILLPSPLDPNSGGSYQGRQLVASEAMQYPWYKVLEDGIMLWSAVHQTHPLYGDLPDTGLDGKPGTVNYCV